MRVRHAGLGIERAAAMEQLTLVVAPAFDPPTGRLVAVLAFWNDLVIERMSFSNPTMAAFIITSPNRVRRHKNPSNCALSLAHKDIIKDNAKQI